MKYAPDSARVAKVSQEGRGDIGTSTCQQINHLLLQGSHLLGGKDLLNRVSVHIPIQSQGHGVGILHLICLRIVDRGVLSTGCEDDHSKHIDQICTSGDLTKVTHLATHNQVTHPVLDIDTASSVASVAAAKSLTQVWMAPHTSNASSLYG